MTSIAPGTTPYYFSIIGQMHRVFKKYYLLAIVAFLLIPVVTILGGMLFGLIDPDIALRHPNYVRNSRILNVARHIALFSSFAAVVILWFLTCFFLVRCKLQSYAWTALGVLGPIGFIILTTLRDRAPELGDFYQRFVGRLRFCLRVPYELCFFYAVWEVTYDTIVFKRDLMIMRQSMTTGVPIDKIIEEQSASSGMWAFGEGMEEMYLAVLIYLLWPILFNAAGHLPKLWPSARAA
jgi:hypothetical protein